MFCKSHNDFFGVLANSTNQLIISALRKGEELSVTQLVVATGLEQSTISHALKRLADCHFVAVKRIGKHRFYSLNKETIIPILDLADNHAKKMCPTCNKTVNSEQRLKKNKETAFSNGMQNADRGNQGA